MKICRHKIFRSQYNAILMWWAARVNASDRDGSESGMGFAHRMNLFCSLFSCSRARKWSISGSKVCFLHLCVVAVFQFFDGQIEMGAGVSY